MPSARVTRPRWHILALALLVLVTSGRGVFWVLEIPILFGDEPAHYSYIQSLATGHGIPITGKSHVSTDALTLLKSTPAAIGRSIPLPPDPANRGWGLIGEQYEGYQTPLYHLLMVPAYWLGRAAGGLLGSVYAIRLWALTLMAVTVPAMYLLAREIFPDRAAVWLLSPAVLAGMQLVNSQVAIGNDALTVLAGSVAMLVAARCRHDPRPLNAVLVGGAFALACMVKTTAVALLPALALAFAFIVFTRRPGVRAVFGWLSAASAPFGLILAPWVLFNLHAYGALSGGRQEAAEVEPVIGKIPLGWAGLRVLIRSMLHSVFVVRSVGPDARDLLRGWRIAAWAAVGAAMLGALGRRRDDAAKVLWLVVSLPLGVLLLALADLSQSGAGASLSGRHLDVLLPLFCVLAAYGAVVLIGTRPGTTVLLGALVAASFLEVAGDRSTVRTTYAAGVLGQTVPVTQQTYVDGTGPVTTVSARTSCRPTAVGLLVNGHPGPPMVDGRPTREIGTLRGWTVYGLATPTPTPTTTAAAAAAGQLTATFTPPAVLSLGRTVRVGDVGAGPGGTPAVEVYCRVRDPSGYRFTTLYRPDHPYPMCLGVLLAWPLVAAWAQAGAAAVVVGLMSTGRWGRRRRPAHRSRSQTPTPSRPKLSRLKLSRPKPSRRGARRS